MGLASGTQQSSTSFFAYLNHSTSSLPSSHVQSQRTILMVWLEYTSAQSLACGGWTTKLYV